MPLEHPDPGAGDRRRRPVGGLAQHGRALGARQQRVGVAIPPKAAGR